MRNISETQNRKLDRVDFLPIAYGLLAGSLMGATMVYSAWAPLQIAALCLFFYGLTGHAHNLKWVLRCGVWYALSCLAVALLTVSIPPVVAVILLFYLGVIYVGATVFSAYWLRSANPFTGFVVGASWVLAEAVNLTVLPLFGTGQLFVRSWSAYPQSIAFTSVTGMLGITFLVVVISAQLSLLLKVNEKSARLKQCVGIGLVLMVATGLRHISSASEGSQVWTLAAVGGMQSDFTGSVQEEKIAAAAEAGADLVVFPELALTILNHEDYVQTTSQLSSLAVIYDLAIVIGYFDGEHNRNRALHIARNGTLSSPYTKTHLVPALESYEAGDGELVLWEESGHKMGIMICQDDNFTRLSRAYAREGVSLVAVPTFDWVGVEQAHFDNSVHRAIESNYGIARAAIGGISAIISARGEVLASMNHIETGAGMVVATLSNPKAGASLFPEYGNLPMLIFSAGLLAVHVRRRAKHKAIA